MRLGILADIHGRVDHLEQAIRELTRRGVDRFVILGDVIDNTTNAIETAAILSECGALGVWGNHDIGLCLDPDEWMREKYTQPVVDFFSTLKPQFECGEYLFSHTFPNQSATDPSSFYLGPEPEDSAAVERCLACFPHQALFVGHFHRWLAADTNGVLDWDGEGPLTFEPDQQYFCVIHAVQQGFTALLDDETKTLTPIRLT